MANFNSIDPNMQYMQYGQPSVQMVPQAQNGVSAVSINIYNPQAYGNQQGVSYPQAQQQQPAMPYYPQGSYYNNYAPQVTYPANYNNMIGQNMMEAYDKNQPTQPPPAPTSAPTPAADDKKKDEKPKTKVLLTDDYIKSLENYMNNQDAKIRLTATKELLERFKEDDTRKTDMALTALLNKALQDPSPTVRFMALTILDVGYATGDTNTANILKQIQTVSDQYGEDALLASEVLLKMSGQRVEVPQGEK